MELFKTVTRIDFLKYGNLALLLSGLVLLAGVISLTTRGLNFGLDFTGGTLIELHYQQAPELNEIRQTLEVGGFDDAVVQTFGTASDIVVRIPVDGDGQSSADLSNRVLEALGGDAEGVEIRRVEFVGPQVGQELAEKGGLALLYVLIGLLIYVSFRFQWRLALGAVLALLHDALVILAFLSIFQIPFDLTVVAAILAVIGYSINDNIVIYDRLRENLQTRRKGEPAELINLSINQTLSRTIVTSVSTLLVLFALFYFGGEIIHAFAYTLIIGIIIATYSSIYIAGGLALKLGISKRDLMPVVKEGTGRSETEVLPERFRNRGA